jgi:chromosomal replication initiator protein
MVWTKIKESLKETLADNIFQLWIEPLQFEQFQGDKFYLSGPDRYFSAYVKQNFLSVIEEKLHENGLQAAQIIFCEKNRNPVPQITIGKGSPATQMRLPNIPVNNSKFRALHPRYTFDEFMVGDCNILAESACRSMVSEDGLVGPCLYINSGTGLGKSHLTHAVAHQVFTKSPMTRLY